MRTSPSPPAFVGLRRGKPALPLSDGERGELSPAPLRRQVHGTAKRPKPAIPPTTNTLPIYTYKRLARRVVFRTKEDNL